LFLHIYKMFTSRCTHFHEEKSVRNHGHGKIWVSFEILSTLLFRTAQTLSVRFQISENVASSRLLITLSVLQLVVFFLYNGLKIYLKMTLKEHPSAIPAFKAILLASYVRFNHLFLQYIIILSYGYPALRFSGSANEYHTCP
uniref:Very-long-chain 3-oxoacyl-CoA synthase n=1 Tax=Angiostrongylus cantonensis TaxID=6313 RepID=A0A0K0DK37_ANGCA